MQDCFACRRRHLWMHACFSPACGPAFCTRQGQRVWSAAALIHWPSLCAVHSPHALAPLSTPEEHELRCCCVAQLLARCHSACYRCFCCGRVRRGLLLPQLRHHQQGHQVHEQELQVRGCMGGLWPACSSICGRRPVTNQEELPVLRPAHRPFQGPWQQAVATWRRPLIRRPRTDCSAVHIRWSTLFLPHLFVAATPWATPGWATLTHGTSSW